MFSKKIFSNCIIHRKRFIYTITHKCNKASINNNNVVFSKVPDIQLSDILIHEYVWKGLDKWRNKTAVVCAETGRNYSYEEIYYNSKSLASFLRLSLNLKSRDTIAILLPNIPEYPIIFLGALEANLKITTINPIYTADEIKRQLLNSKTKVIFTLNDLYAITKEAIELSGLLMPIIVINQTQHESTPQGAIKIEEILGKHPHRIYEKIGNEETALLPYSSGTTGLPKGVELTHKNIVSNLQQISVPEFQLNLDTDASHQDVVPVILPLYHIYGLIVVMLRMFLQGCKVITVPKFDTNIFIRLLEEHKPNILYAVPPIILMILNNHNIRLHHLESLRQLVSGAAPLGIADVERFFEKSKGKVNFMQIYGMTETSPITLHQSNVLEKGIKLGASGLVVPNTQCKIIDINDLSNTPLHVGKSGELLIKGPQIMKGYYNNEEATANTIVDDGWLKTGDIAHFDEDGQFFITDRLKELIKVKGFQVAPAELEEVLRDHPAIADAAIVGVPHRKFGEAPKAFIVAKPGLQITPQQVNEFINSKVAKYKQLTGGVVIVDSIPKTPSGKTLRRELKLL